MDTMLAGWHGFVTFIASVPDVIWSGVIASVLTLSGILIANGSNTKRLRLQLKHDVEQKDKERLAALRKEVYLQAPKEAVKAMAYLGKLPSRDLAAIGDDEGIAGYAAVSAQIALISELPTVEAVSRLGNTFATALIDAMHGLDGVQDARTDNRIRQQRLDVVTAEIQRIQGEQQQMSESGNPNPARTRSLDYWLQTRMQEADSLRDELDQLRAKEQRLLFEYHKAAFERMPTMTEENIKVMRAVRKEIGLSHDLDDYEAQMRQLSDELRMKVLIMMEGFATTMEAEAQRALIKGDGGN